ncbi:MAG: T9SS type A sorting domain-containing protein, partial [Bacteroidales bacterium]|nr:T9SS type A sorting domain-containing protein [Bacteroidales bacterium]
GAGTYNYNQAATLNATPTDGYEFANWSEDESIVSTDPEYSFNVTTDRTLTANFDLVDGINEIGTPEVFIFPNPAQDFIYIKTSDISHKKVVIQIHNSIGQSVMLKETVMDRELLPLNISALKPGLYYITVRFENRIVSKTIILQ